MADYSLADLKALVDDDHDDGMFGGGYAWIILIFLFFLAFGGGWGFGGNNRTTAEEFQTQRDVLTTAAATQAQNAQCCCSTQLDIFKTSCETQKAVQDVNYQTLLGFSNQNMNMAQCCCDIKNEVLAQNQLTRDLIQSQYIDGLRTAIVDLKTDIANRNQNEFILSTIGQWRAYPPVNPYTCYNNSCSGCGCN